MHRIIKCFNNTKPIKLMTHVVGGYPDLETSAKIILSMADSGADIIEIQLPFSDPTADGPSIVEANHHCLRNGVTTQDVLSMIKDVRSKTDIPLLIMSYINPIFVYGIDKFLKDCERIGIDGFIIPDYPPDDEYCFIEKIQQRHMAFVPLIAPNTSEKRMIEILTNNSSPFVYVVLRLGVTGKDTDLCETQLEHLQNIKSATGKFTAAGFGISNKDQINYITGYADCAVIGSAILKNINSSMKDNSDITDNLRKYFAAIDCKK